MELKPILLSTFVWLLTTLFLSVLAVWSTPIANEPENLLMYITLCVIGNVVAFTYVLCTAIDANKERGN